MKIEYRKATLDEAQRVCYIVQHTKSVLKLLMKTSRNLL